MFFQAAVLTLICSTTQQADRYSLNALSIDHRSIVNISNRAQLCTTQVLQQIMPIGSNQHMEKLSLVYDDRVFLKFRK